MKTCFVPDCDHTNKKNGCNFTKFPNTPNRKKRWVSAVLRADRLPTNHSFVCSCHFVGGRKGISLRKTPTIFRRNEAHRNLFTELKPNARKRLLKIAEADVSDGGDGDISVSYSSGLLSASVSQSDMSHDPASSFDDLGTSALGDDNNASERFDDTFDECPKSHPTHSSTPHPVNTAFGSIDSTPKRRKTSNLHPDMSQSPSASHPCGWSIGDVMSGIFLAPSATKTTGSQTEVETKTAATQCLLPIQGIHYSGGRTHTVDMGVQTSIIMFDDADHFVTFGDNLEVVKSLLGEVLEWRKKLVQAEEKIAELSAKNTKLIEESHIKDESIKKLREDLREFDGKHSSLLLREKELFESLQEEKARMLYRGISTVDTRIAHFTGLPNAQIFEFLCSHFTMPLQYFYKFNVTALSREDQILLTLMKLRCNFDYLDLAVWFNVGRTTVANVFLTILDALHRVIFLEALKTVPSRKKNKRSLPECFKGFEDCRMIIDCTEVRTAAPKSLALKNIVYSNYKHYDSLKGLVGIAPNGALTFASTLYPGSTSDKQVVQNCGLLKIFEPGDMVLADKGFTIRDLLRPLGADLNIPPFLETPQFTPDQVVRTRVVARARIHVERAIQRIKGYDILDYIPMNLWDVSSKIFQVCAALTNFQNPLIKEVEDKMKSQTIDWDDIENDFDAVWWQ